MSETSCSDCDVYQKIRKKNHACCVEFRWVMEIDDNSAGLSFEKYTSKCFHPVGSILVINEEDEQYT